jgi:hypothetical protein
VRVANSLSDCRAGRLALVRRAVAPTLGSVLVAGVSMAPSAVADSAESLRAAVMAIRPASCAPLRSEPVVEHAAETINRSTDAWLGFTARAVPLSDALPLLKDLGYGGNKAAIFQGAGLTDAVAIKSVLLEGHAAIPDCAYADYGVSVLQNQRTENVLVTLVLAGA